MATDPIADLNEQIRQADDIGAYDISYALRRSREVLIAEQFVTVPTEPHSTRWEDHVDWERPLTEDTFWQAVADANDLDVNEIADGDIVDWI